MFHQKNEKFNSPWNYKNFQPSPVKANLNLNESHPYASVVVSPLSLFNRTVIPGTPQPSSAHDTFTGMKSMRNLEYVGFVKKRELSHYGAGKSARLSKSQMPSELAKILNPNLLGNKISR